MRYVTVTERSLAVHRTASKTEVHAETGSTHTGGGAGVSCFALVIISAKEVVLPSAFVCLLAGL